MRHRARMPTEIRETLCGPSKATAVGLVRREAQLQPEPEDETQGPASMDLVSPASERKRNHWLCREGCS